MSVPPILDVTADLNRIIQWLPPRESFFGAFSCHAADGLGMQRVYARKLLKIAREQGLVTYCPSKHWRRV